MVERTARLVAQWQAVGWAHGVLNTNNMSILGITLDYGPYGFMDDYDPGFICNHSDYNGRYAFNQQPYIGLWNLSCLAQTLLPLAPKEALKAAMDGYQTSVDRHYRDLMRAKLGLVDQQACLAATATAQSATSGTPSESGPLAWAISAEISAWATGPEYRESGSMRPKCPMCFIFSPALPVSIARYGWPE